MYLLWYISSDIYNVSEVGLVGILYHVILDFISDVSTILDTLLYLRYIRYGKDISLKYISDNKPS